MISLNGLVEHATDHAVVRVQLIYAKNKIGESGEVNVENGSFRIPISFVTQSRAPVLVGSLLQKCDRKPETVIVTLVDEDQEYDRISLSLAKDFTMIDPGAYAVRSEILLHRPPNSRRVPD